jgi:hypothetical protein
MTRLRMWIGRRPWLLQIDRALHRAYSAGLIDSWTLHEIDARAKGYTNKPYPPRPTAAPAPTGEEPRRGE